MTLWRNDMICKQCLCFIRKNLACKGWRPCSISFVIINLFTWPFSLLLSIIIVHVFPLVAFSCTRRTLTLLSLHWTACNLRSVSSSPPTNRDSSLLRQQQGNLRKLRNLNICQSRRAGLYPTQSWLDCCGLSWLNQRKRRNRRGRRTCRRLWPRNNWHK